MLRAGPVRRRRWWTAAARWVLTRLTNTDPTPTPALHGVESIGSSLNCLYLSLLLGLPLFLRWLDGLSLALVALLTTHL